MALTLFQFEGINIHAKAGKDLMTGKILYKECQILIRYLYAIYAGAQMVIDLTLECGSLKTLDLGHHV